MEIRIKTDESIIVLSDDKLDNDAFVQVQIQNVLVEYAHKGEPQTTPQDVPLNDLMSAVIAFESKRSRRISEEERFRD